MVDIHTGRPADMAWRVVAALAIVVVAAGPPPPANAQDADEPPPRFTAAALLPPAVAQGPHHRVAEEVKTEGYLHEFTVSSAYGTFTALGRTELAVRIGEIEALAALDEVSKTAVFLASAGQSVVRIGQGAASVVTDPAGAAKGLGAGVKRLGVNLGRRTQRAVSSAGDDKDEGSSAGASAVASLLGVTAASRRWAQKVGVDPYTTNLVLRKALEDIARVDAAGAIATKVVVPVPAPMGTLSSVGGLVWGKDPEELRKMNEQALRALGVTDAVAGRLFGNRWFTLTHQTRFAGALQASKARGVADYVETASAAATEREALFFVESAEMLQQENAREPVREILTDSRAMAASDGQGRVRALLPLDWIAWNNAARTALGDLTSRAREELRGSRLELVVTGGVSERARRELDALGWTIEVIRPAP